MTPVLMAGVHLPMHENVGDECLVVARRHHMTVTVAVVGAASQAKAYLERNCDT